MVWIRDRFLSNLEHWIKGENLGFFNIKIKRTPLWPWVQMVETPFKDQYFPL